MTIALHWVEASPTDEIVILALMQVFYVEDKIAFTPATARAVKTLLAQPERGRIFLLYAETGDALRSASAQVLGYMVLTFGFSLEFGGRYVLLDELYLAPEMRGKGEGRRGLAFATDWARDHGVEALRLEVNHHNAKAKAVYFKSGFTDDCRDLMTRKV